MTIHAIATKIVWTLHIAIKLQASEIHVARMMILKIDLMENIVRKKMLARAIGVTNISAKHLESNVPMK